MRLHPAPTRDLLLACVAASALIFASAPAVSAPAASEPASIQAYDLKGQSLESALHVIALRSGRTILAPSSLLAGKQTTPLKGDYSATDAVRLLLEGSGLEVVETGNVLVVREIRGARTASEPVSQPATAVAEVMVTGTRLRGAGVAAPVNVITRTDIERTGYSETGDVIRSLPEDWAGGQNPGVVEGAALSGPANQNMTNASTANLRGLGSDATLVLIDGQRPAAEGDFQAVDISVIPLAAISRIDVVTDGASALYGADAVAGVVNFVLRKDYNGAELTETLGDSTRGGGFDQTYDALAGKTWSTGHVLASVEYSHQDGISTTQRDFTSTAAPVNDLLDPQTRLSFFGSASQDLTAWASFHLNAIYSQRETGFFFEETPGSTIYRYPTRASSYFVAPGLSFTLPGTWTAALDGVVSGSHDHAPLFFPGGENDNRIVNTSDSVELSANGDAFRLPSGPVKLALGGGYLSQSYDYTERGDPSQKASRTVGFVFGEANVPLVAPDTDRLGLNALDLSVAGRFEHYSDFGDTANPKLGLRYQPVPGLAFRATWGTSFKAPEFQQESLPDYAYLYPGAFFGAAPGSQVLFAIGGAAHLNPERSTSWTAGFDWTPPSDPALKIAITYFDIDYTDRIVQPLANPFIALTDPSYAPYVIANPTSAQQAAAIAGSSLFVNVAGSPYNPSSVIALLEDHYVNATDQKIHGLDVSIKQGFALPLGALEASASGTWMRVDQQLFPGVPSQLLSGTLFNAPTVRARGGLTWLYEGFSATGTVNYVSSETDTNVTPERSISSWTTVDCVISYRFGQLAPTLPKLEGSLAVTNLFDRPPPFAKGAGWEVQGVNFDSTNASGLGRFVSLTLKQRF